MSDPDTEWLTPKEAAARYNILVRRIYRWIERGYVEIQGEKGDIRVSAASIQRMLDRQNASDMVSQVIDGQPDSDRKASRRELGNVIATSVVELTQQRDQLAQRIETLQEARITDQRELGRLQGRLEAVESELTRIRRNNTTVALVVA